MYLVATKDQKGHKVRAMVATKKHTTHPDFLTYAEAVGVLIDYMSHIMNGQDFYIVDNKYASVPSHFHIIACDTPLEDEEDPMFVQTPKIVFPIRRK